MHRLCCKMHRLCCHNTNSHSHVNFYKNCFKFYTDFAASWVCRSSRAWAAFNAKKMVFWRLMISFVSLTNLLDSPSAGLPKSVFNDSSEDSTGHGFLGLPGEIRNKIYRYLLTPSYLCILKARYFQDDYAILKSSSAFTFSTWNRWTDWHSRSTESFASSEATEDKALKCVRFQWRSTGSDRSFGVDTMVGSSGRTSWCEWSANVIIIHSVKLNVDVMELEEGMMPTDELLAHARSSGL